MTRERWPSPPECLDLLAAHRAPRVVLEHAACVRELALRFLALAAERSHPGDARLVSAAALLHDIGRTVTSKADHGWRGAELLRAQGIAEPICRAVERHVGAGLTREDAARLGMPARDYLPEALEEKIVCHADTLFHLDRRQAMEEEARELEGKGLEQAARRMRRLHAELARILGQDPDAVP